MLTFERAALDDVPWAEADAMPDRVLFQTRPWLEFVRETQGAEPVVAALHDGPNHVGWFTGAVVRRAGVRILGSPFPGWTTMYMGFNLVEGASRAEALAGLPAFAFGDLRCLHVEVCDRHLSAVDVGDRYECAALSTFLLDVTKPEEQLQREMKPSTRRNLRHALGKHGLVVEEAHDDEWVDDFYAQLCDVFAKQSLVPTYPKARVRALVDHLGGTGNLLRLRVRDPEGTCIATAVFPAFNGTAYYWGGASWREHQRLRPNEAALWTAFTTWKARGVREIDLAGAGGTYKRSYGDVTELDVPVARLARFRSVARARDAAKRAVRLSLRARGRLRKLRGAA